MKIRDTFVAGDIPVFEPYVREIRVETDIVIKENEHLIAWSFASVPGVFSVCVRIDGGKLCFNLIRNDVTESFSAGAYRLFASLLSVG